MCYDKTKARIVDFNLAQAPEYRLSQEEGCLLISHHRSADIFKFQVS